ncbi:MAG TPA: hypothetical protein PLJ35_14880 [Anaerolineae bacterium]|nr:hypothetical protein [Anaerolineae bacterium]HPL26876.1 hypothetical protein [Anaerolineae bacterium]
MSALASLVCSRNGSRTGSSAREQGYRLRGRHHEIYLGDPRRADPTKLKTALRQGVEKA